MINDQLQKEIARRKQVEKTLRDRLEFETMAANLSTRFVNLPEEELRIFKTRNMKSLLAIPLTSGKNTLGACVLGSTRLERSWPDDLVQRFHLHRDSPIFIKEIFSWR